MVKKINITSDDLSKLFLYEQNTGRLYWRVSRGSVKVGAEAGTDVQGYLSVGVDGGSYYIHRLVWLMTHGEICEDMEIDHINGIKSDNRIVNLRLVTKQHNQWNRVKAKGFYKCKQSGKWRAQIALNGRVIWLGNFNNKEDAHQAYLEGKKKYHNATKQAERKNNENNIRRQDNRK